jgi:hypothetical protein
LGLPPCHSVLRQKSHGLVVGFPNTRDVTAITTSTCKFKFSIALILNKEVRWRRHLPLIRNERGQRKICKWCNVAIAEEWATLGQLRLIITSSSRRCETSARKRYVVTTLCDIDLPMYSLCCTFYCTFYVKWNPTIEFWSWSRRWRGFRWPRWHPWGRIKENSWSRMPTPRWQNWRDQLVGKIDTSMSKSYVSLQVRHRVWLDNKP